MSPEEGIIIRLFIGLFAFLLSLPGFAQLEETRYCGPPKRDATGSIIRRADVITAFNKRHPCPITGLTTGACSGWSRDHIIPLVCGGCDSVSNLQWLPNAIKSCSLKTGLPCKDRWEQQVYCDIQVLK